MTSRTSSLAKNKTATNMSFQEGLDLEKDNSEREGSRH